MDSKHQNENMECESTDGNKGCSKTVKKNVSVVASVCFTPIVTIPEKEIKIKCRGPMKVRKKKKSKNKECKFFVQQKLRVQVPLHFDSKAEVNEMGVICNTEKKCP